MKNRNHNPKNLSYKIWIEFAKILIILFIVFLIINITIIEKIRSRSAYERLREIATISEDYDNESVLEEDGELYFPMFFTIHMDESQSKIENILINDFVRKAYLHHSHDDQIIQDISNLVVKDSGKISNGKINYYFMNFYYYGVKENRNIKVYIEKAEDSVLSYLLLAMMIAVFLVFIFIVSRKIAKKIASPIQELKGFTDEIASKNWDYTVKMSDTIEINDLIQDLNKMKESLKEADNREKEFLQSVSHDLKTPVMIIKGYIEAVKDGKYKPNDLEYIDIIQEESNRLERKIIQLLRLNTLEHIQRDQSIWEEVSIDRMIRNLVQKYKIICPDIDWELNLRELEISGDVESLLIAFENILDNQIRFAKQKIKIDITDHDKIIISNDGPHFSIENPDDLFESHTKDKQGNFGLGLAIVRRVIRIHGGEVYASNCEQGVKFTVVFNRN
ncbi:HAMP domain-containing sensor histidine kinase [Wukongibacter baidiensis]|uniref:HAMP domain-containing sensor histidine kinase n=1 Tax=Wukongibacter baidiensis TaxID=1723361 RepID=UPI003D7F4596